MKNLRLISLIVFCLIGFSVYGQKTVNLNDETSISQMRSSQSTQTQNVPAEYLKMAKTARSFVINPALQSSQIVQPDDLLTLDLFTDKSYEAKVSKVETDAKGTLVITANLMKYKMGYVVITTDDNKKSMVTVCIPELNENFITYGGNTAQSYLIEIDKSKLPFLECGNDESKASSGLRSAANNTSSIANPIPTPYSGKDTIDVLVVYTKEAQALLQQNGVANNLSQIQSYSQKVLNNSNINLTIRFMDGGVINQSETKDGNTDIGNLSTNADVKNKRESYGTDLVMLIVSQFNYAGISNGLYNATGYDNSCFLVVQYPSLLDNYTPIHEIGHNLGAGHNWEQTGSGGMSAGPQLFLYSAGSRWTGTDSKTYVSVMSYDSSCHYPGGSNVCVGDYTRTPYFSDPAVSADALNGGKPTGSYAGNSNINAGNGVDNALTIRQMKHIVAAYRTLVLPTPPTNVTKGTVTSNSAVLSWTLPSGGAASYNVYNGTTKMTTSPTTVTGTSTSCTITGLNANTTYNFTVKSVNSIGVESTASNSVSVTTTTPPCTVLTGLTATVTTNSATVSWAPVAGATSYTLQFSRQADMNWLSPQTITVSGTSYTLSNIISSAYPNNGAYYWRVKVNGCADSYYSPGNFFIVQAGATNPTVTGTTSSGATVKWDFGYAPKSYTVRYKLSTAADVEANWKLITVTDKTVTLSGLTANAIYNWQVRVDIEANTTAGTKCIYSTAWVAGPNFTAIQQCTVPTGLTATVTTNSATVSWTPVAGGVANYTVQIAKQTMTTPDWTTAIKYTANGNSLSVSSLTGGYYWRVKITDCSDSYYSPGNFFIVRSGITNPAVVSITSNSVGLKWDAYSGAANYTVQYKPSNSSAWITAPTTTTNSITLSGLTANTGYSWQVSANIQANTTTGTQCIYSTAGVSGAYFTTQDNLKVSNITCNSALLSWTISGATSYTVYYGVYGSGPSIYFPVTASSSLSVSLNQLQPGKFYCCWAVASDGTNSGTVYFSTLSATNIPSQPTGLIASASSNGVTLKWNTVSGASNYAVLLGDKYGSWYNPVASTPTSNGSTVSIAVPNLTPGRSYSWKVAAVNTSGSSDYISGSDFTITPATPIGTLQAPSNLQVSINNTSATLKWSTVNGATSYIVQYKLDGAVSWTNIAGNVNGSWTSTPNLPSGTYIWQIAAINASGSSAFVTGSNFIIGGTHPLPPTNLQATVSGNTVNLSWIASNGATNYEVYYYALNPNGIGANSSICYNSILTSTTSISIPNLLIAGTYSWQIFAANSGNYSYSSATGPNFTISPKLSAPTGLQAKVNGNYATLSWTTVSGATGYTLQCKLTTSDVWCTWGSDQKYIEGNTAYYNFSQTGTYNWQVMAKAANGSSVFVQGPIFTISSVAKSSADVTALDNIAPQGEVTLYPNPVHDLLTVKGLDNTGETVNATVYNINGSAVKIIPVKLETTVQINVSDLPKNNYILNINGKRLRFIKD